MSSGVLDWRMIRAVSHLGKAGGVIEVSSRAIVFQDFDRDLAASHGPRTFLNSVKKPPADTLPTVCRKKERERKKGYQPRASHKIR
jgi:hypothetical protein